MNLIEGIQTEQNRVRELLKQYEALGPSGMFGMMGFKHAIQHGDKAIASGDGMDILAAYAELKGCE